MATVDDLITDALVAIEAIRPVVPLVAELDPEIGAIAAPAITLLYEGLVALRAARESETPEEVRAHLRAKVTAAIQELAALKFGASINGGA